MAEISEESRRDTRKRKPGQAKSCNLNPATILSPLFQVVEPNLVTNFSSFPICTPTNLEVS